MAKARVIFRELLQDSQDLGSDDEHMVSRVFFDFEFNGKMHERLYSDIKQPVGSSFETANLEVSSPGNYKGPFNFTAFRDAAEWYYRSLIGSQGVGLHVTGANNRMRDNRIIQTAEVEFEVESQSEGGPW